MFLFVPDGEAGEKARQVLMEVAADWKIKYKRRLIFTEIYVWFELIQQEAENYKGLSDYFKLNPKKHFLVFVKSAEKLKYLYNGDADLTKEAVEAFIKGVEGRKIKPFKLDQETRPASEVPKSD